MTDRDVEVAERARRPAVRGRGARRRARTGCKLVASDPEAYDRFYNVVANPMLWFIQHYLWDLSQRPGHPPRGGRGLRVRLQRRQRGPRPRRARGDRGRTRSPVVMVHDYHLYTLPALIRRERPDAFLHHFVHIPWTQPDAWRRAARPRSARELYDGLLANDIIGFHTAAYRRNFLQCCRDLMDFEVDFERGRRALRGPRGLGARLPAADRRARDARGGRAPRGRSSSSRSSLRRRREHIDPARRPRRPLEERAARLHRLRPVPRAAPRVRRARHVHRPADAVADRRAGVRRVPRADRGASSPSSTTATARRTGCRSSSSSATTSRRRSPPTSTTTCCWSTRCSTA